MKSPAEIADVVEVQTWAGNKSYTISALKEDLEALMSDADPDQPEQVAQEIFDELVARASKLGDAYPFVCDGHLLRPRVVAGWVSSYLFCLSLSLLKPKHIKPRIRNIEFETLVMQAAQKYFGGHAIRIGAPWKTTANPTYLSLLQSVSALIPELGAPSRTSAPAGGDGGWDVVIVKNFGDCQFPRLIALGNCATGKTDWRGKGKETEPSYFWTFFTRSHRSVCITFLAAPFVMDEDDRGRKSGDMTLTFDRMRICEHKPSMGKAAQVWLDKQRGPLLALPLM